MNTNYFLNLTAGNIFGTKTTPAIPTDYYIGLSSMEPTVDGVCTGEPTTDTGYTRVKLSELSEPVNGVINNLSAIDFLESTGSWGKMQYYVVYDSVTDGNLLFYGSLSSPITVDAGTVITIKSGELTIKLCNPTA